MPITHASVQGPTIPGEVILPAVRWYLRYPLAYLHVSEILTERGLFIDASCIWRWAQAYVDAAALVNELVEANTNFSYAA